MDADGVTVVLATDFACGTAAEEFATRAANLHAVVVGLRCANGLPANPLISFGLAGALRDDLPAGTVIDATRVVDESGEVLWDDGPLGVPTAVNGTILAADRVIDDPSERRQACERTGADAVDLESGPIARAGQLRGVIRAVSDTPLRPLGRLSSAVKPDGRVHWPGIARSIAASPFGSVRTSVDSMRALRRLARALEGWHAEFRQNLPNGGSIKPL